MDVGVDGFNLVLFYHGSLMETTKESDLQLSLSVFFPNHLGRPVREALSLFSIDNLVERLTRLSKPILVISCDYIPVAILTFIELCQINEHLPRLVCHVAVAPMVDHHIVDNVFDVCLELLLYSVLLS